MRGFIVHEDKRFIELERMLEESGDDTTHSLIDYQDFDYIIFGLKGPDASLRYLENGQTRRFCNDFFKDLKLNCKLYSFMNNPFLRKMAKLYELSYETFEDKEMVIKGNADLTSEAVLAHLIMNRNESLKKSTVTIFGYGHLAKSLVHYLNPIVKEIRIVCRNLAYDREIGQFGKAYRFEAIQYLDSDIFINTVPSRVIHKDMLALMKQSAILLDVSSFPYGFDLEEALFLGLEAQILPGLPAKYAYKEAAALLYDAVMEERIC